MDGSRTDSSLGEEIRRGSGAGASPRNGYGSGGKTSGEHASVGMFERASCVASRFVTADMTSTARGKWRHCTEGLDDLSTANPPLGVLPDQKFGPCEALGIACRRKQLAGFFDGGGRDGLIAMPPAIPISAMSCLGRCSALGVDRIAACSLPRRSHRSGPGIHSTEPTCGAVARWR
jgi:hypothetical protein